VLPYQVDVSTNLTRHIRLNVPLVSAAMDVTESRLAIAERRAASASSTSRRLKNSAEVDCVAGSESGMIVNPITLAPANKIYEALELMKKYSISGVPITEDGSKEGKLVGILTNRDLRFETNVNRPIADIMTREPLYTVPVGTTLDAAREELHRHKVEKLLVVDKDFRLKGLITVRTSRRRSNIRTPEDCSTAPRRRGRRRRERHRRGRSARRRARRRASSSLRCRPFATRHRYGAADPHQV
jgi:IMP dehydrogenase